MLTKEDEIALRHLPCFQLTDLIESIDIEEIIFGLSHRNYKVTVHEQQGNAKTYFVKNIANRASAKQQISIANLLAKQALAPQVVYIDSDWFVTLFIEGVMLKNYSAPLSDKYKILINHMVKFHQNESLSTVELSRLSPLRVLNNLSSAAQLTANQQRIIDAIILEFQLFTLNSTSGKQLNKRIKLSNTKEGASTFQQDISVVCHGDFNFSNLLILEAQVPNTMIESYVIDYETACIAEPEYDIAMMVAVNAIDVNEIQNLIDSYQKADQFQCDISLKKVMRYLVFSLVINGLWYFERFRVLQEAAFHALAVQQFEMIDLLTNQRFSLTQQMR